MHSSISTTIKFYCCYKQRAMEVSVEMAFAARLLTRN
jgi:hypothetical protein